MHSFLWLSNTPLCIRTTTFYPFICQWTSGLLHVLAIVNSAAMNNVIHVSFSVLVSSGYMPRSGIARSYGGFIPSFFRRISLLFHIGCINLHSHQQCKSVSLSPHPLQHLLFIDSDWCEVISHCIFD